jgi:hypothetical protein
LIIPAFSPAIALIVLPKIFVCSSSIKVITLTSGSSTFVESRRPPMPVSTTITSHFDLRAQRKNKSVNSSQNVGSQPSGVDVSKSGLPEEGSCSSVMYRSSSPAEQ